MRKVILYTELPSFSKLPLVYPVTSLDEVYSLSGFFILMNVSI
ncbi:MAG: hypothetical protein PHE03_09100 [Bacteroidales bacterium]|nr:hypothetical protein [Bacteroidales bacterium]MDD3892443.1 hypothetical protein [Bacteroidales bacterium]